MAVKYSKILDVNDNLIRIEKGNRLSSSAMQITKNEFYCLSAGIKTFIAEIPEENLSNADWGIKNA